MKIRWLIPVAASATLVGCGNSANSTSGSSSAAGKATASESVSAKKEITEDNLPEMTVEEVEAAIAKPGSLYVYDVNPKDVYDEGHVPGAKWISKKPTADQFPADKAAKLVFYCANEH